MANMPMKRQREPLKDNPEILQILETLHCHRHYHWRHHHHHHHHHHPRL